MKTLYLECSMGAAGDMLAAALLELAENPDEILETLNGLGLPGVRVSLDATEKCGIRGSHFSVTVHGEEEHSLDVPTGHVHGPHHSEDSHHHDGGGPHHHPGAAPHSHAPHAHHSHTALADMQQLIASLPLSNMVKKDAAAVYALIAEAEGAVHGRPVEAVHFHEVGSLDAVADVVSVCLLMERLAPGRVLCSPIHLGSGQVRCAHGVLPVPAPAVAHLLRGVPTYGGEIRGELCTPTGAALLRYFVDSFGPQPVLSIDKIGYGMGQKDFPAANCVRAFLGEAAEGGESVSEIRCNLDDMTGEAIGYASGLLLEAGALDVYTVPIYMKKNRPGQMLCCLCRAGDTERFCELMLHHTTSFGVRVEKLERRTLPRRSHTVQTPWGGAEVKSAAGPGWQKAKPEFEDAARIAREQDLPLARVNEEILRRAAPPAAQETD